jgi:type I restriction enzyme S subunit
MRNTSAKPVLRFPEFKEDWKEYKLSQFLTRYSENNKDEEFSIDEILSLSSHYGIVSRKELLEDTYSNVNHLSCKKTRLNDLVYGKSISASYPYGLFKVNDYKDGLLSTLYYTFKVKEFVFPKFLDCYFCHLNRANNFLKKYVLVGDRYITADADYLLSGKIYLPTQKEEQKKITDFLIQFDNRIVQLKEKKENLELYKKGITQKIFSQKLRFKDENGKDFPEWKKFKLGDLTIKVGAKNKENEQLPIYSISNKKGFVPQSNQFAGLDSIERGFDISLYKIIEERTYAYNPARINVGSIGYSGSLNRVLVSSLYVCFKTKKNVFDDFFNHYLDSSQFNKAVLKRTEGGVRQYLFYENFSLIVLNLPSIKEQEKIASFLNAISQQIALVNEQLEETRTFKKVLLNKLFAS